MGLSSFVLLFWLAGLLCSDVWYGTLTFDIVAEMAGSKCADIENLRDASKILAEIAKQDMIAHAPFTRPVEQKAQARLTLVLVMDAPEEASLADCVDQQLKVVAGQKFPEGLKSIKRTSTPSWSSADRETIAREILNESARFWYAHHPSSDKLHLKGNDQNAAAKYFIAQHHPISKWYESCLRKIKCKPGLITTRLHLTVATHCPRFAHGVHCDPFANTKRFIAAKEVVDNANLVYAFKHAAWAARDEVGYS